jgi:hypothetical protein
MAAPNIVNVTTITANAAYIVANNSVMAGVLTNSAASGSVIKVNSVLIGWRSFCSCKLNLGCISKRYYFVFGRR